MYILNLALALVLPVTRCSNGLIGIEAKQMEVCQCNEGGQAQTSSFFSRSTFSPVTPGRETAAMTVEEQG